MQKKQQSAAAAKEPAASNVTARVPPQSGTAGPVETDDEGSQVQAQLRSLHERRALLSTVSQLVSMNVMHPLVAGAVVRLINDEDPTLIAALRLFAQNDDIEELVDTLVRVGTTAFARSRGTASSATQPPPPLPSTSVDASTTDDIDWGGEDAAVSDTPDRTVGGGGEGQGGLLSREHRDMLLRCATVLRDSINVITPQQAAVLMRAIAAAQSGKFVTEHEVAAAPAFRSIAEVYSSNHDLEMLLATLVRVARLLSGDSN
jgi:hypothetical protein